VPILGEVLDRRFELLEVLGEGGMGQVFKARDRELDRPVALKVLLPQMAADPLATSDMKREVRLAQRLSHPCIVAVYDYRLHERTPFIVMEFVAGELLLHHIYAQPGHRLAEPAFRRLAEPIMAAVEYAHQQGVIHRDLKPENIMVTPAGSVKLMDFGIAAAAQVNYTRVTGRTSSLSVAYASPEQINGENPTPSMDIYSLGCVFYAMLAGHPPFYQGEILYQQLTRDPPPIPDVSPALSSVVLNCLVKDPRHRLQSVADVRVGLVSGKVRDLPRPATPPPDAPRPMPTVRHDPATVGAPSGGPASARRDTGPTGHRPPAVLPRPTPAAWLLGLGGITVLVALWLWVPRRGVPPVAPPPAQVAVSINALPWARVRAVPANGDPASVKEAVTPCLILLPPGPYRLELENGGITPARTETIRVGDGGQTEFEFSMAGYDPDAAVDLAMAVR
jgi:serine/threonine-protein kinase